MEAMTEFKVPPPDTPTLPPLSVNGTAIPEEAVLAEARNQGPANEAAIVAAQEALVIRELLLQEARHKNIVATPQKAESGERETDDDALIRVLLDQEIDTPEADTETCQRYFENNQKRFRSADLYEPAHILFAARPSDTDTYAAAIKLAEQAIETLTKMPGKFAAMAKNESACQSGKNGGSLGQITRGDTVPEFETFLVNLEEGQLCPVPVRSRYGVHVLRMDRKIEGRPLPFDMVKDRIADYLQEAAWRRASAQFVQLLAGQAEIVGVEMAGADSPLVQ